MSGLVQGERGRWLALAIAAFAAMAVGVPVALAEVKVTGVVKNDIQDPGACLLKVKASGLDPGSTYRWTAESSSGGFVSGFGVATSHGTIAESRSLFPASMWNQGNTIAVRVEFTPDMASFFLVGMATPTNRCTHSL